MDDDSTASVTRLSGDGLVLAARHVPGPSPEAPCVLCLHGLTRNSRDFEDLISTLRVRYRVIAPDQRGRGRSGYDPEPANYNLVVQTQDTWEWLDYFDVASCAVVGTSMGALMGVTMAVQEPNRIKALVLNDAGPVIDPAGLARIASYVGRGAKAVDWPDAATALAAVHGVAYPDYGPEDWMRMAHATYVQSADGLRLDYDPRLAEAFGAASGASPELWPLFEALGDKPVLVVRGALSDILSAQTVQDMQHRLRNVEVVTVPNRGHAPDLGEKPAQAAILTFLERTLG